MRVNHRLITLARESRGLSQIELARQMGISQGKLSKMETGILSVSPETLKGLSEVLRYPEEKFSLDDQLYGTPLSEVFHRKRASVSQHILTKIYARLEFRRIEITRLLHSVECAPELPFPRLDPDEYDGDIAHIAQLVRATWRIPRGPVENVTATIERAGGIVIETDFETDKIDAISTLLSGLPPLFFVNQSTPSDRLRYTLCHEVGHMVMHVTPSPAMEEQANAFAAEFLMPADEIRDYLHNVRLPQLAALKRYWKVSMSSLLKRAGDLECVDYYQKDYLWRQFSSRGYKSREPAELDLPREKPSLLADIIAAHRKELSYSASDVAKAIALDEREVAQVYPSDEQPLLHLIQ